MEGERNAREAFVWNVANYIQNCFRDVNEFVRLLDRPTWPTIAEKRKYLLNLIDSLISSFGNFDTDNIGKEYQQIPKLLLTDEKFPRIIEYVYQDLRAMRILWI